MVRKTPDEHFGAYTPNNAVKHRILANYLTAYLGALSRVADAAHYIDGFAGRGTYADKVPGSPLTALTLLGEGKLPFTMSLVEASKPDFEQLRDSLAEVPAPANQIELLLIENGKFSDQLNQILSRAIYKRYRRVATFAFIDPCGVAGLRIADIARILSMPFGECLLLWNYDGFNRLLGGATKGTHDTSVIVDMLTGESALAEAMALTQTAPDSEAKEHDMLALFVRQLRDSANATYILPFRFFAPNAERTSHYLIHCGRNALGFKIMKEVMGKVSQAGEPGTFEFIQNADARKQMDLLSPSSDDVAMAEIQSHLRSNGPCRAKVFTQDWVARPADFRREKDYRRLLCSLEERGVTEVLDKKGTEVVPAERRRRGGTTTIAPDLFVRLRNKAATL
jgi:three-Cys-motif partner protein